MTIDRALEWRSRHRRNFHAPSALDPLPIPSVADGSALPPLLPGSGLFRRARWNYVRKAFLLSLLAPSATAPAFSFRSIYAPFAAHLSFSSIHPVPGALLSTSTSTNHPTSVVSSDVIQNETKTRGLRFFGDFLCNLCRTMFRIV